MAGDWLKMELELSDKPEVHYIAGALNLDPDAVVGKLFRVWCWFNKHTTDGNAHGVTFLLLDRITGVTGFGEAMAYAGWMEQRDKTLHMPHFEYHTSESSKKRALTAKRVANHKAKSNAEGNAVSVTNALPREEKNIKEADKSAQVDPLWGDAITTLTATGLKIETARTFIGSLLKDYDAGTVTDALIEARGTADPRGYTKKLLAGKPRKRQATDPLAGFV